MKIGFAYSQKRVSSYVSESEAEFDSPKMLQSIRRTLKSLGHQVVDLELDANFTKKLLLSNVDLVFNIAEGEGSSWRESQVPTVCEMNRIPYVGSTPEVNFLTLDKQMAKLIVSGKGVPTPGAVVFENVNQLEDFMGRFVAFPTGTVIVKPCCDGSSKWITGDSITSTRDGVVDLVTRCLNNSQQKVIVEDFLPGREFTVAMVGGDPLYIFTPQEVIFKKKARPFYQYAYKVDFSPLVGYKPVLEGDLSKALKDLSYHVYECLGLRDMARLDFRMDVEGKIHFLEANALPGLAPKWSHMALIAEADGFSYKQLIEKILYSAIDRHTTCALDKNCCGVSVKAMRTLKQGEFIIRGKGYPTKKQTKYTYQVAQELHWKPTDITAYFNHSCEPTVGIKVPVGGPPDFFALRKILNGEELTLDYATFEYETKVFKDVDCLCHSPSCRKRVGGFTYLERKQVVDYLPYVADYLKPLIKKRV